MNEHKLTKKVQDSLRALKKAGHPVWWKKIHGGPFQTPNMPDIIICLYGIFVAIELKSPEDGEAKPTPGQEVELRRIAEAGGTTLVSNDLAEIVGFLAGIVGMYEGAAVEAPVS